MAGHKRLGIHWGETGFVFVEVSREAPALTAFVPFSSQDDAPVVGLKSLSDDIKLLDVLQKTIRNKGFSTVQTYLSLPSKDILIRWFVIPWVKTSEIQDIVGFEIKKYIPFSVDEISYTYYPKTVTKDGVRQIGILFVGIRKNAFEKYTNVLTQAGLNVVYSEPSAMSLVRALVFKRLLDLDQVTAILQTAQDSGELIISSKGQVKFIRDFRIAVPDEMNEADDALKARVFGEVRMSLDFFTRQYGEEEVNKIIVLSSGLRQSFWSGLGEDLGLPVAILDPLKEIGGGDGMDKGGVSAFGATMAGNISSVIDFNLSEGLSQPVSLKKEEVAQQHRQLILPVLIGIACAALLGAVFFVGGIMTDGMRQKVVEASMRAGAHANKPLSEIESFLSTEQKKMAALSTLPIKERMVPLIVHVTTLLAKEGVWFNNLDISFEDVSSAVSSNKVAGKKGKAPVKAPALVYAKITTKVNLSVSGYVYLNDSNREFNMANELLNLLRKDETLSALFQAIRMTDLKAEQVIEGKRATVFTILCEG